MESVYENHPNWLRKDGFCSCTAIISRKLAWFLAVTPIVNRPYNRTAEKMNVLIKAGAKGAGSIEEAVKEAELVMTCLLVSPNHF